MFIDVEYYLENNASLTFHDFPLPAKLRNLDSTFTKTTFLKTAPVAFFSAQHSVLDLVTRVNHGIFSFPLINEIFIDVEHYLENNI